MGSPGVLLLALVNGLSLKCRAIHLSSYTLALSPIPLQATCAIMPLIPGPRPHSSRATPTYGTNLLVMHIVVVQSTGRYDASYALLTVESFQSVKLLIYVLNRLSIIC